MWRYAATLREIIPRCHCDGNHIQRWRRCYQLWRCLDLRRGYCLRLGLDDGGDHLKISAGLKPIYRDVLIWTKFDVKCGLYSVLLTLEPLIIRGISVGTSCVTTVLYTEESTRVVHVGVGVTMTVLTLNEGWGALRGLEMPAWPGPGRILGLSHIEGFGSLGITKFTTL